MEAKHRVSIRLRYTEFGTPWKWWGECQNCTWECMSWAWLREDGTGTLTMANEHARGWVHADS